jgi:hypothetical protein
MSKVVSIPIIIAVVLAVLVFAPLAILWALNTLFGLGLSYTFTNWLATLILSSLLGSKSAPSSSK